MQRLEAKSPPERPLLSEETGNVIARGRGSSQTPKIPGKDQGRKEVLRVLLSQPLFERWCILTDALS
jgi:hypothetical protein